MLRRPPLTPQLYRFKDRRGAEMILAPTNEEEVTRLIGADLSSPKQLPIRVYQISACSDGLNTAG